jgi:hypothetical protein
MLPYEAAIEKVRDLSASEQDHVAMALLAFTGEDTPLIPLDDDTRAAIREGTAQARRGEFVPDAKMEAFFKRHGLDPPLRPHPPRPTPASLTPTTRCASADQQSHAIVEWLTNFVIHRPSNLVSYLSNFGALPCRKVSVRDAAGICSTSFR